MSAESIDEPGDQRTTAKAPVIRYDCAIKERPTDERPRERLEQFGASSLSVTELLAIQLRTGSSVRSAIGVAGELLKLTGGLRGLAQTERQQLLKISGIGPVK